MASASSPSLAFQEKVRVTRGYQATADFLGGALGGVTCIVVGQPFDTVKVKLQTYPHLYKGTFNCFRVTFANEGIRGLFQGTVPAVVSSVGENAVLFMCYGIMQNLVVTLRGKQRIEDLNPLEKALSGSAAAIFSSLWLCPTELVKCRLQAYTELMATSHLDTRIGPWGITKDIIKQDGIFGLFQGLTSTWLRELPGYFLFFFAYDFTKKMLTPRGKTKEDLGPGRLMAAGGIAGACLWASIYPIDVVKSRIQVQSLVGKMPGFLPTMIQMMKTEGVVSFFHGITPCVARAFPSNAALFIAYEYTRKYMTIFAPSRFRETV